MPNFTITLSDAAVAKATAFLSAYNKANGTSLTAQQWLLAIAKRELLKADLAQAAADTQESMAATYQTTIDAAIAVKQQQILDAL